MKTLTKATLAAGTAAVTAAAVAVDAITRNAIDAKVRRHYEKMTLPDVARRTERVEIKSADGLTLVGHLLRVNRAKRFVIAVHGWRSSWQHDFNAQAALLEKLKCSVLYVDQRAHGGSGGRYICFGVKERFDVLRWLCYAEKHTSLPIYLMGVSMGATSVMLASELISPGRVRGIIADCGFTSAGDIWRYMIQKRTRVGARAIYRAVDARCMMLAGFRGDTRSTVDALKNTEIPFLFIHGGDDRFVPTEMSKTNYAACQSDKRLFIVPGAKHGRSCLIDPEGYERELEEFFGK